MSLERWWTKSWAGPSWKSAFNNQTRKTIHRKRLEFNPKAKSMKTCSLKLFPAKIMPQTNGNLNRRQEQPDLSFFHRSLTFRSKLQLLPSKLVEHHGAAHRSSTHTWNREFMTQVGPALTRNPLSSRTQRNWKKSWPNSRRSLSPCRKWRLRKLKNPTVTTWLTALSTSAKKTNWSW